MKDVCGKDLSEGASRNSSQEENSGDLCAR